MAQPYELSERIGSKATLGLIVLQTDETLEPEFARIFNALDIAVYASRVPSGADVTTETLAAMEAELPRAAGLFPPSLDYGAIGYGCTSGATVIGPGKVAELVGAKAKTGAVTNPLSAVAAGLFALGVNRVGVVTPYIESVTAPVCNALKSRGFSIGETVSFEEAEEAKVARIDPASIAEAARVAGAGDVDAVFLSCTNLRTLDIIEGLEAELGKPVISSNLALAWHMARLAGVQDALAPGRLWGLSLAE